MADRTTWVATIGEMIWRVGLPLVVAAAVVALLLTEASPLTDAPRAAAIPAPAPASTTTPLPPTPTTSTLSADDRTRLTNALIDAVADAVPRTDIGFALYDQESGEDLISVDADEQFYTASVVKLLIALDTLHTGGWHAPDDRLRADITEMLSASHDGIADALWNSGGRTAIVSRMVRLIGLKHTAPPRLADQWEMTSTTANDLVAVYRFLTRDVPSEVSTPILDAMAAAKNPAADGFPQYFGIPDALPGKDWAVKQGWMEINRAVVLNTTGLIGSRYVVVLLAELPLSTSFARGRSALTAGIAAVAPALSG
jgi:hypothetical protein